jgi:hypothetical protein
MIFLPGNTFISEEKCEQATEPQKANTNLKRNISWLQNQIPIIDDL